jgi:hypothetical protein
VTVAIFPLFLRMDDTLGMPQSNALGVVKNDSSGSSGSALSDLTATSEEVIARLS